jgi:hypothetical protein
LALRIVPVKFVTGFERAAEFVFVSEPLSSRSIFQPMRKRLAVMTLAGSALFAQITSNPNTQIYAETPSGTLNGVNAAFTLNYSPSLSTSVSLYRNGIRQKLGTDYTVSGKTISFAPGSIPGAGDLIVADYVTGATATLLNANNLSDVSNVGTARANLGLGSAATQNTTAFDPAGAAAALLKSNNNWTGAQTFTNLAVNTNLRVVTATETAKSSDHTLILSAVNATETLPATPATGQELYLVNASTTAVAIGGNGRTIWNAGSNSSSITLTPNATCILQFDGSRWWQIK